MDDDGEASILTMPRSAGRQTDELTILGVATLVAWALISIAWVERGGWVQLIWLCDVATLLTGIGLLLRSKLVLTAQLVGTVAYHVAWHVDTLSYATLTTMPLSSTVYMFGGDLTAYEKALSFFQHSFVVPVTVWGTHRLGAACRGWMLQTVQTALIFLLTYLCTEPAANINWIFGAGFADLSPASIDPTWYYGIMTVAPALLIYYPVNRLLRWWRPAGRDAPVRGSVSFALLSCTVLLGASAWVGWACGVDARMPDSVLDVPADGPLPLERIPVGERGPRLSSASYGAVAEQRPIGLFELEQPLPRVRGVDGRQHLVLAQLSGSVDANDVPQTPYGIVVRGERGELGTVIAAVVVSDAVYLQPYLDLQPARRTFELHCQLGVEGMSEFAVSPAGDPRPNRIESRGGTAGLYALVVVAVRGGAAVARSPVYLFRRTGNLAPGDADTLRRR